MSKKLLSLLLALVLVFSLVACSTGGNETEAETPAETDAEETVAEETEAEETEAETPAEETETEAEAATDLSGNLVGMVTDTGGVDDQSFNQSSWAGLEQLKADTGADVTYVQSEQEADFLPNVNQLLDQNTKLTWGIGFLLAEAIQTASQQAPDANFAIIDNAYEDAASLPNVTGIVFKAQEPSYMVGYIAGHTTQTDKVGFVGGIESLVIDQFEHGYRAGVEDAAKELGKEIEVFVQYANSFGDQAIGKSITTKMYADGADIVFHAAGGVGIGVIEAAREANKLAIGVDSDQAYLAPENVLTSALKRVDLAVYDVSKRILEGEELGGTTLELTSDGGFVGIPEWEEGALYPKEVYDKALAKQQEMVDGTLVPPYNAATFEEYISAE